MATPTREDLIFFTYYLYIIRYSDSREELMSGLGNTMAMFKEYLQWNEWLKEDTIKEDVVIFVRKYLGIEIFIGDGIQQLGLLSDFVDMDELDKRKNIFIKEVAQAIPNKLVYVSSYYQEDMHDKYFRIMDACKECNIECEFVFQSSIYEEQGSKSLDFVSRFSPFIKSIIYYRPSLMYVHLGWSFARIASSMMSIYDRLKHFETGLKIIPDSELLHEESFLAPNQDYYYKFNYDENFKSKGKELSEFGRNAKKRNFEAYEKLRASVFNKPTEQSNLFKGIVKRIL